MFKGGVNVGSGTVEWKISSYGASLDNSGMASLSVSFERGLVLVYGVVLVDVRQADMALPLIILEWRAFLYPLNGV